MMAEDKNKPAAPKPTPRAAAKPEARAEAKRVEKEADKKSKFVFPGTGDDTPDTAASEQRRLDAAEAAQTAIAGRDQELDPEANRDRVRNEDDRVGSSATSLGETALSVDGYVDTARMSLQVSQFDESAPNLVNHLAYPSKHLIAAQKAPSGRRAEILELDEEERRASVGSAAKRTAARKSSSEHKGDDKK